MIHLPISKIVYPGRSLGYFEGKAIFTDEGLPGEVVEVEPRKIKKKYLEGITKAVLQPSPRRRMPRCNHYQACSLYQIMDYDFQLDVKLAQLREIFSHQLHLDLSSLMAVPSPLIWGYRNRAHFHLVWQMDNPVLAYHQPGEQAKFIAVDKCYLLPEKANDILAQTLKILQSEKLREIREIEIRYSFTSDDCLVILFLGEDSTGQHIFIPEEGGSAKNSSLERREDVALFTAKKDTLSFKTEDDSRFTPLDEKSYVVLLRESTSSCSEGERSLNKTKGYDKPNKIQLSDLLEKLRKILICLPVAGVAVIIREQGKEKEYLLFGEPYLWEEIEGTRYALGPRTFFQVNIKILKKLIADLKEIIPLRRQEKLADLYCGVGTFGLALASQVSEVYGVEILPENISLLKKNLRENRIENFKILAGPASQWAHKLLSSQLDVVIVDPPRRGLEKKLVQALVDYPCPYLIYLSCNPATLARDLKELTKSYDLKEVRFYDFFPQTPHVETLVILKGRNITS